MPDLERTLAELARDVDFPSTPDLVPGIRARLAPSPRRRRFLGRRGLAIAVASLAAAIGVAFAVPQARTAILRVFGVGSVSVRVVDELPEAPPGGRLVLGDRVLLADARRRVSFPVAVPAAEGFAEPDAVYLDDGVPGGIVFFLYGTLDRPTALLSQFSATDVFAEKSVGPGTTVEEVRVGRDRGYWIEGAPHTFAFTDLAGRTRLESLRLATNTLVWEREGITLRLEGDLDRDEAVEVAESLR
jgi:hypothetical protein